MDVVLVVLLKIFVFNLFNIYVLSIFVVCGKYIVWLSFKNLMDWIIFLIFIFKWIFILLKLFVIFVLYR